MERRKDSTETVTRGGGGYILRVFKKEFSKPHTHTYLHARTRVVRPDFERGLLKRRFQIGATYRPGESTLEYAAMRYAENLGIDMVWGDVRRFRSSI